MASHRGSGRSRFRQVQGAAARALPRWPAAALLVGLLRLSSGPAAFLWGQVVGRGQHDAAAFTTPGSAVSLRGVRTVQGRSRAAARCRAAAEGSASWVLPTVDKDIEEFHQGRAGAYAWVQTSETLYVFAPVPPQGKDADGGPPKVELSVKNEGWDISFTVEGTDVLQGRLAHAVKPGSEIWMIEEARDGRSFAVAEFDKLLAGMEWTSVLSPQVSFVRDYSRPKVQLRRATPEEQAATVEATLGHLQRKRGYLQETNDIHKAVKGDVLSVDIQGFELTPDGSRGAPLDIGAAEGMQFELGSDDGRLLPAIHEQLVGVGKGETRDVQVTLGQKGGNLGGKRVIIAVTCNEMKEQVLPKLDDDFARAVKRDEQFAQAGTESGIPEEEEHAAETFTMEQLRGEITAEVANHVETEAQSRVKAQLEAAIMDAAEIHCEWGDLSSAGRDGAKLLREEKFAAVVSSVAEREDLLKNIDDDAVNRQTWHVLGTPKEGKSMAEVGDDPAREFQEARRKVFRRHQLDEVLRWLEEHAEIVEAAS